MQHSTAYASIGSNLGDSAELLLRALEAIALLPGIAVTRVSRVYRTEPVGDADQPWFYNQVAELDCQYAKGRGRSEEAEIERAAAFGLLSGFMETENMLGRMRDAGRRYGPRFIDIDLLLFGGLNMKSARLTLPHPRMLERAFVLVPLAELAPEMVLPNGKTAQESLAGVNARLEGDKIYQH